MVFRIYTCVPRGFSRRKENGEQIRGNYEQDYRATRRSLDRRQNDWDFQENNDGDD